MTVINLELPIIILFFTILVIQAVIAFQLGFKSRILDNKKSYRRVSISLYILCFLMIQTLAEIDSELNFTHQYIHRIPVSTFVVLIFFIGSLEYAIYRKIQRTVPSKLSTNAIKESMDNLPLGICFSKKDGLPMLVNWKMDELCREITGRIMLNMKDFQSNILASELPSRIKLIRKDPIIVLKIHDTYWEFESIDHGSIMETQARDITSEYQLFSEIRRKNQQIKDINTRLKNYNVGADHLIRDQEILYAKERIHDNIGSALMSLRVYLSYPHDRGNQREDLVKLWKRNTKLLKDPADSPMLRSKWDNLMKAVESIDLNLKVEGDLPEDEKTMSLLTDIVHESVNNAVIHGKAKNLMVRICPLGRGYGFSLSNDGIPPRGPVQERGGLKNIRNRVELEGGSMKIYNDPAFRLEIRIGGSDDV